MSPTASWRNTNGTIVTMKQVVDNVFHTRAGRKLEVREYGDDAGHPVFFFHGLIGSHYQAAYIADQAREYGLRIIAPNRPGVGASEFIERKSPLDAVDDIEDVAAALGVFEFSVIGISGGTPYALATSPSSRPADPHGYSDQRHGANTAARCTRRDGPPPAGDTRRRLTVSSSGQARLTESDGSFSCGPRSILAPADRDVVGLGPPAFRAEGSL